MIEPLQHSSSSGRGTRWLLFFIMYFYTLRCILQKKWRTSRLFSRMNDTLSYVKGHFWIFDRAFSSCLYSQLESTEAIHFFVVVVSLWNWRRNQIPEISSALSFKTTALIWVICKVQFIGATCEQEKRKLYWSADSFISATKATQLQPRSKA